MKIDHSAEIAAALAEQDEGMTFDEQHAAATAAGKSVGIAVIGERKVAYAADRMDFTAQTVVRKKPWRAQLDDALARLAAMERAK